MKLNIETKKPDIEGVKLDIESGRPGIDEKKPDIGAAEPGVMTEFLPKAAGDIRKLRETFPGGRLSDEQKSWRRSI